MIDQIEDSLRLCKEIKTILPLYPGGMKENPGLYLMINGIERNITELKQMEEGKWVNVKYVKRQEMTVKLMIFI